jgi:hypothetical protein
LTSWKHLASSAGLPVAAWWDSLLPTAKTVVAATAAIRAALIWVDESRGAETVWYILMVLADMARIAVVRTYLWYILMVSKFSDFDLRLKERVETVWLFL